MTLGPPVRRQEGPNAPMPACLSLIPIMKPQELEFPSHSGSMQTLLSPRRQPPEERSRGDASRSCLVRGEARPDTDGVLRPPRPPRRPSRDVAPAACSGDSPEQRARGRGQEGLCGGRDAGPSPRSLAMRICRPASLPSQYRMKWSRTGNSKMNTSRLPPSAEGGTRS